MPKLPRWTPSWGRCLQIVSDNTLVVFSTEQGSAFPYGGKWTCYENGLHTGLIMRWPGKIEAGSSCDALVQYVDILPTLLQVAGSDPTQVDTGRAGAPDGGSGFDGKSFWHLAAKNGNHHRDYVYGAYTNRGVRDGTDYPIRSVRSKRYKYIANLNHEGVFQCNVTRFMDEMGWAEAAQKNPALALPGTRLEASPGSGILRSGNRSLRVEKLIWRRSIRRYHERNADRTRYVDGATK